MEEKKMSVFEKAQVKRMVLGMKPMQRTVTRIDGKISELSGERHEVMKSMQGLENAIYEYVGADKKDEARHMVYELMGWQEEEETEQDN